MEAHRRSVVTDEGQTSVFPNDVTGRVGELGVERTRGEKPIDQILPGQLVLVEVLVPEEKVLDRCPQPTATRGGVVTRPIERELTFSPGRVAVGPILDDMESVIVEVSMFHAQGTEDVLLSEVFE